MVVLGNSSRIRRAVFIVDASSALSGIFDLLLSEYVVPCIEYLNGGPLGEKQAEKQLLMQSSPVQYGLVSVSSSMLAIPHACTYFPVTSDPAVLVQYLRSIRFEGGLIEQYCNASEGLAASMECLDMMDRFSDSGSRPDVIVEKHCVFVTNLPPSSLPAVESIKYGGMTHFQLAELMCKESVNFSIVSPRWLSPYKELFLKASPSPESALLEGDHSLHHSCMVLLMGVDVPSLKARKHKCESSVSTTLEAIPTTSTEMIKPEAIKQEVSQGPGSVSVPMPSPAMPFSPASVPPPPQAMADRSPKMQMKHSPHPATPASMQMDTFMHLSPKSEPNPPSVGSVSGITSLSDPSIASMTQASHAPVPSPGNPNFSNMVGTLASSLPVGLSPHSKPSPPFASTSFTSSSLSSGSYAASSLPTTAVSQSLFSSSSIPSSSFPSSSFGPSSVPSSSFSGVLPVGEDSGPAGSSRSLPIQLDSPVTDAPRNIGPPSTSMSALASSVSLPQSSFPLNPLSCSSGPSLVQSSPPTNTAAPLSQQNPFQQLPNNMSTGSMPASSIPSISSAAPIASSMSTLSTLLTSSHSSTTLSSFSQPANNPTLSTSNTASLPAFPQSRPPTTDPTNPAHQAAAKILQEATLQAQTQGLGSVAAAGPRSAITGLNPSLPMSGHMGNMAISEGAPQAAGSQQLFSGMVPGSQAMQQPPQQSQSVKIWTGSLESFEMRGNQRIARQIKCSIFSDKQDFAQDVKVDLWPNRMSITIYPKTLLNAISNILRFNHAMLRKVTFQFLEPIQTLPVLQALKSPDSQRKQVGIIQMVEPTPKSCPIKAFLIVWTDKQRQFTGLVPLDQKLFFNTLKQTVMQQKLQQQQQMQQQGMLQQQQQQQQPGMQQSGIQQPGMQQSGMQQQPGMQQPGMQQSGMQQPGMQQSGMQQAGMQQSSMQQSGVQQPGMQQSGMQQSGMQQSGMQQSGMQQPGMQQSGLQQSGMQQPGMQQSGMQQPGMQQSAMQQPGMQQSAMQQPGMLQQPGMQQAGMQQPGMQQTGMQQASMQQSGMQQAGMQQRLSMQQQPGMQRQGMQQTGMHQAGLHQQGSMSSMSQPAFSQTSSTSASGMMTTGMVSQPSTMAGQLPISTQPGTFMQQNPQNQAPRPPFSHITGMGPAGGGEAGLNVSSSQQNFTGLSTSAKPGSTLGMGQPPMANSGMTQQRMQHPGITGQQPQQQQQGGAGMMQQGMGMMPQQGGGGMLQSQMMAGGMGGMMQQNAGAGFPGQQQQQGGMMQQSAGGGMMAPSMGGGGMPPQMSQPHHAGVMQAQPPGAMPRQPMTQNEKLRLYLQNCAPEQKQLILQRLAAQKLRQQQSFGAQQPGSQQQAARMAAAVAGQQQAAMMPIGMRPTLPPQQQQQPQQHPGAGGMDPNSMYFTN